MLLSENLFSSILLYLWVDCDNLPAAAPDHKDPLQPLGQHLQELKV